MKKTIHYLRDEAVYESANSTVLANRRALTNKKEFQISQIFVDLSIWYVCQRGYINAKTFLHWCLQMHFEKTNLHTKAEF